MGAFERKAENLFSRKPYPKNENKKATKQRKVVQPQSGIEV